jgi:hypothetical protein
LAQPFHLGPLPQSDTCPVTILGNEVYAIPSGTSRVAKAFARIAAGGPSMAFARGMAATLPSARRQITDHPARTWQELRPALEWLMAKLR